ncbi:MAG: hypothetical protein Fur0020_05790 [Thermodesulfovibrionia bacterium]
MSDVKIKGVHYNGWDNCVQITNGIIELIVTIDVGPRIIRYGFVKRENELCESDNQLNISLIVGRIISMPLNCYLATGNCYLATGTGYGAWGLSE